MSTILKNNGKLKKRIKNLRLNDRDIIPLIRSFNAEHPEVPMKVLIRRDKPRISHGPVIGFSSFNKYKKGEIFDIGFSSFNKYEKGKIFELGYSLNEVLPQISENLSYHFGISFQMAYVAGYRGMPTIRLPGTMRYYFYKGKISPFFGVGLSYNIGWNFSDAFNLYSGLVFHERVILLLRTMNSLPVLPFNDVLIICLEYSFGAGKSDLKN